MLFENNAVIAGRYFKAPLGVLKKAAADVIVVDYNPPTHLDENNINGHILFRNDRRDVVTTVGNGKVLYEGPGSESDRCRRNHGKMQGRVCETVEEHQ